MKRLLIIGLGLYLTDCARKAARMDAGDALDMIAPVRYVHDKRTGLCYAVVASRHVVEVSQIPCTKEVQAIIDGS